MTGEGTERPGAAERPREPGAAAPPGRGGRMSRRRERDAVLRLLRGEDLGTVSRSLGATAATRHALLGAHPGRGRAAGATPSWPPARPAWPRVPTGDGEALESGRLKARPGEMPPEQEPLEARIAALEGGRPLARRRPRS